MAKLRRNHRGRGGAAAGGAIVKVTVFALLLLALIWGFRHYRLTLEVDRPVSSYSGENYLAPAGGSGTKVSHEAFHLSYRDEWEQAEWVAYVLDARRLAAPWVDRQDDFRPDPLVDSGSATDEDYRGSGYDRGHLAPFADFAYDEILAGKTFYYSNVSPQVRAFNQGVWRELEELTRDWARRAGRLYVVSGPVTTTPPMDYIGVGDRVAVPAAFFKVLLDLERPELEGIGFLLPNARSERPVLEYALPIDSVEAVTGLDFFADLMPPDVERRVEASVNFTAWPTNTRTFNRRLRQWNKVK